MDHGYNPFWLRSGIRTPRLCEDFHVLLVEHEAFLVKNLVLLVEFFSCEVSIGTFVISSVNWV
jgi:hypothetical protein